VSLPEFLYDYWQSRSLFLRGTVSEAESLVKEAELDSLIASLSGEAHCLMLVKDGHIPPLDDLRDRELFANLEAIKAAYRNGYTVILTKLHRRLASIGIRCRALDQSAVRAGIPLSQAIGANLYITPARSKGFPIHWDNHDVIIIQLRGRKSWRVFGPPPLHASEDSDDDYLSGDGRITRFAGKIPESDLSEPQEFSLSPGDVLYVPYGHCHDARTDGIESWHLSISVYTWTWCEMITMLARQTPALRMGIPPSLLSDRSKSRGALQAALSEQLAQMLCGPDTNQILSNATAQLVRGLPSVPTRWTPDDDGDVIALSLDTDVRAHPTTVMCITEKERAVSLTAPGCRYETDISLGETLRFIAQRKTFKPRQIPGPIGDQGKIELVSELIRERVLSVLSDDIVSKP
jgi:hypothetical protein